MSNQKTVIVENARNHTSPPQFFFSIYIAIHRTVYAELYNNALMHGVLNRCILYDCDVPIIFSWYYSILHQ